MATLYRTRPRGPPVGIARPASAIPPRLPCLACLPILPIFPSISTYSACQTRWTNLASISVLAYIRAGIDASIDAYGLMCAS